MGVRILVHRPKHYHPTLYELGVLPDLLGGKHVEHLRREVDAYGCLVFLPQLPASVFRCHECRQGRKFPAHGKDTPHYLPLEDVVLPSARYVGSPFLHVHVIGQEGMYLLGIPSIVLVKVQRLHREHHVSIVLRNAYQRVVAFEVVLLKIEHNVYAHHLRASRLNVLQEPCHLSTTVYLGHVDYRHGTACIRLGCL